MELVSYNSIVTSQGLILMRAKFLVFFESKTGVRNSCLRVYFDSNCTLSVDDYPVYDPKFFKMIREEAHRRHEAMKADKECDKNLYIRYVTQK